MKKETSNRIPGAQKPPRIRKPRAPIRPPDVYDDMEDDGYCLDDSLDDFSCDSFDDGFDDIDSFDDNDDSYDFIDGQTDDETVPREPAPYYPPVARRFPLPPPPIFPPRRFDTLLFLRLLFIALALIAMWFVVHDYLAMR